jgi:hypothetical protein
MKVTLKNIIVPSIPLAVLLVLGCIGIWFSSYFGARTVDPGIHNSPIVQHIESAISSNTLLSNIISLSFTLFNAFLLAQINNRFTIIRTRTFLPAFTFLLLMASWNDTHLTNGSHFVLTLICFSLFYFFNMSRNRNASEQAFMGSFLISVSSLLINPLILLIPICWIGFIIFQSFSLRTFLASIFGSLAPWILFISSKLLFSQSIDPASIFFLKPNLTFIDIAAISLPVIIYSAFFLFFTIVSIIALISLSNGDAIDTRNKLNFLILLLITLMIIAIMFRDQFVAFLPFIALVFSLLFSHPFTLKHSNLYGILFNIFCFVNIAYVISKYILI